MCTEINTYIHGHTRAYAQVHSQSVRPADSELVNKQDEEHESKRSSAGERAAQTDGRAGPAAIKHWSFLQFLWPAYALANFDPKLIIPLCFIAAG